ncbi:MAG: hypothetical protein JXQ96_05760 [Cyclobacteriaceae bacterium]
MIDSNKRQKLMKEKHEQEKQERERLARINKIKELEEKQYLLEQRQLQKKEELQLKIEDRKKYLYSKYDKATADKIFNRRIWLGMTSGMVLDSIGLPKKENKDVYSFAVKEQWIYENRYLYFTDGILDSWQDR